MVLVWWADSRSALRPSVSIGPLGDGSDILVVTCQGGLVAADLDGGGGDLAFKLEGHSEAAQLTASDFFFAS